MLTETKVRNLKPKEKLYRLADSHGLTIEVNPNGSKLWRHRNRFNNKATMMSSGSYPEVLLLDARQARDNNKQLIKQGINPIREKAIEDSVKSTFKEMFSSWIDHKKDELSIDYVEDTIQRANNYLIPVIGDLPIKDIKSPDMRNLLLQIQKKGLLDTLQKVKGIANGVFSYSVGMGLISVNPVRDLPNDIFKKKPIKHYATITNPKEIGWLLEKLKKHKGCYQVNTALLLAPHVFLRPVELTELLWDEIDFDARLIRISADRMKMSKDHIVPMSNQVFDILKELSKYDLNDDYVFPTPRNVNKSITTSALRVALRSMGIDKDKFTTHGFRHMASTRLNELGYRGDLIEIQLAHTQSNKVRAAYNHAEHLQERKKMMQDWSDYLDKLTKQKDNRKNDMSEYIWKGMSPELRKERLEERRIQNELDNTIEGKLSKKHKEVFGVEPKFFGLGSDDDWDNLEAVRNAIRTGKPLNQYEELSPEDRKLFEQGSIEID